MHAIIHTAYTKSGNPRRQWVTVIRVLGDGFAALERGLPADYVTPICRTAAAAARRARVHYTKIRAMDLVAEFNRQPQSACPAPSPRQPPTAATAAGELMMTATDWTPPEYDTEQRAAWDRCSLAHWLGRQGIEPAPYRHNGNMRMRRLIAQVRNAGGNPGEIIAARQLVLPATR